LARGSAGNTDETEGHAMWQISDFEAAVFIMIVAAIVALAVAIGWP
jgi:hypothetical protein